MCSLSQPSRKYEWIFFVSFACSTVDSTILVAFIYILYIYSNEKRLRYVAYGLVFYAQPQPSVQSEIKTSQFVAVLWRFYFSSIALDRVTPVFQNQNSFIFISQRTPTNWRLKYYFLGNSLLNCVRKKNTECEYWPFTQVGEQMKREKEKEREKKIRLKIWKGRFVHPRLRRNRDCQILSNMLAKYVMCYEFCVWLCIWLGQYLLCSHSLPFRSFSSAAIRSSVNVLFIYEIVEFYSAQNGCKTTEESKPINTWTMKRWRCGENKMIWPPTIPITLAFAHINTQVNGLNPFSEEKKLARRRV